MHVHEFTWYSYDFTFVCINKFRQAWPAKKEMSHGAHVNESCAWQTQYMYTQNEFTWHAKSMYNIYIYIYIWVHSTHTSSLERNWCIYVQHEIYVRVQNESMNSLDIRSLLFFFILFLEYGICDIRSLLFFFIFFQNTVYVTYVVCCFFKFCF